MAPEAALLVSPGRRAEARDMVARWQRCMLQAELERWQLRGVAWPLLALIDW